MDHINDPEKRKYVMDPVACEAHVEHILVRSDPEASGPKVIVSGHTDSLNAIVTTDVINDMIMTGVSLSGLANHPSVLAIKESKLPLN